MKKRDKQLKDFTDDLIFVRDATPFMVARDKIAISRAVYLIGLVERIHPELIDAALKEDFS